MKKKYICLFAGLATVLLVGCGNKENANTTTTTSTQESVAVSSEEVSTQETEETSQETEESKEPVSSVELSSKVAAGPDYVVSYQKDSVAYWDEETETMITAQTARAAELIIMSEGYDELKKEIDKINAENKETMASAITTAKDFLEEGELEYAYFPWENESSMGVNRSDEKVFSLWTSYYNYSGGAHGYYYSTGYNFDPATGKKLAIGDFVTDVSALHTIVHDKIAEKCDEDDLFTEWEESLAIFFDNPETLSFLVYDDAIYIWFNAYELAPYSTGDIDVDLSMEDLKGIVNKDYFHEKGAVEDSNSEIVTTEFYEKVVLPLTDKFGEWTYNQVKEFIESTGFPYEAEAPDAECDGDIRLVDPENDAVFYAFCWPIDVNPEEAEWTEDWYYLDYLSYRLPDWSILIESEEHSGYAEYSFVNEEYEESYFYSLDDLNKYAFRKR